MSILILCTDCGESLGDVYLFYHAVKTAHIESVLAKQKNVDINKAELNPDLFGEYGFILDALHIVKPCCRSHMIGSMDLDTYF